MKRPFKKHAMRPACESLESRKLLAGQVTVSVSGGDLVISGDGAANHVRVEQIEVGNYRVTGLTRDGSSTKINGTSNGSKTFRGVFDDFAISLNGGNDRLDIVGASSSSRVTVPDDLEINMGSGNDYTSLKNVIANDDVILKTGSGKNQTIIDAVNTFDDMSVSNSNQSSSSDFDDVSIFNSRIGVRFEGTLSLDLADGHDLAYVTQTSCSTIDVRLRGGDDFLSVRRVTVFKHVWLFDGGSGRDGLNRSGNDPNLSSSTGFERFTTFA